MGKKCARRIFAVFMVLFLTVGILTFPSDAQEAAYTQLVQRREASLKHVLRLPIDQAIDALVRAGFHYNESFFSDQEFREAYFQAMLNDLSKGYISHFSFNQNIEDTLIYINTTLCALHLQLFFLHTDPEMASQYLWKESDRETVEPFSSRELCAMSDQECVQVLEDYGLEIPKRFVLTVSEEYAGHYAKESLEYCLNGEFETRNTNYNNFDLDDFAMRVQLLAMKYDPEVAQLYREFVPKYDRRVSLFTEGEDILQHRLAPRDVTYLPGGPPGLEDSFATGPWTEDCAAYNGYAYVLGESAWAEPGSFSATDCDTCSLYSVVNAVVQDLDALGFASRFDTSPLPTLELEEQLLCVRTGPKGCHFMKAASLDQWYHKPGTSVSLRWKHPTPDYKIWTNEGLCGRGYSSATAVYNSTIYYIIYWAKGGPGPDINSLDPITE